MANPMAILVHFYVNWVENLNRENLKLAAWKLIILFCSDGGATSSHRVPDHQIYLT